MTPSVQQLSQAPSQSAVSDGAVIVSGGEVGVLVSPADETSDVTSVTVVSSAVHAAMVNVTNNAVVIPNKPPPAALAHPIRVNERKSDRAK